MNDTVTTKILRKTRENLQLLSRITGEQQLAIMDRAVTAEMKRPENQERAREFVSAMNSKKRRNGNAK